MGAWERESGNRAGQRRQTFEFGPSPADNQLHEEVEAVRGRDEPLETGRVQARTRAQQQRAVEVAERLDDAANPQVPNPTRCSS